VLALPNAAPTPAAVLVIAAQHLLSGAGGVVSKLGRSRPVRPAAVDSRKAGERGGAAE
jgi:hypothetical protein